MKNVLEKIVENINYDDLAIWRVPSLSYFSQDKTLYPYQIQALKNIIKVLYKYYSCKSGKQEFYDLYKSKGLKYKELAIKQYLSKTDRHKYKENARFKFFQRYFQTELYERESYISGLNFLNRACFWMATGSGKSLVLIKTIEILNYLQSRGLIPKKEILLLLPREDLIRQFKRELDEFNTNRENKIELINLKNYEEDKHSDSFAFVNKVYYYRSDLLRDERKENILDFRSYENHGNWYVFLDEAHKGTKESSLMQDYISVLSKNGFLFNFSATFVDNIDYLTTCYNFNLEKFILAGYGKNLYLSKSYFEFTKDKDDFNERDKQKQVLKSLLTFTLVKKEKQKHFYHHPLLITLVNSINTKDADLILFFKKLEEIASDQIEESLLTEAKEGLKRDFLNKQDYVFGKEQLELETSKIDDLTVEDLLKEVFNSTNYGKIEIIEGEKGKEIALKLQTSEKPFALIKIGDTGKFKKEHLGTNYSIITGFDSKKYFENINQSEEINLLLGSRSFYEGWDSNRPNVINMINIGKQDAKKFVLQGIGRGIRIEPKKGLRKRLDENDPNKNALLETLFVFATDKNAVKAIIETVENEKNTEETEISLFENENKPFDLLIPCYKDEDTTDNKAKFNIAQESLNNFKSYFASFDTNTLLLKTKLSLDNMFSLKKSIEDSSLFQIKRENVFYDMDFLLNRLIDHISVKAKKVSHIKEISDEIIHFKHIKVINFSENDLKIFKEEIKNAKNTQETVLTDEQQKAFELLKKSGLNIEINKAEGSFCKNKQKLIIKNIAEHYYQPLIYSEIAKVDYIKHIINVESEINFIKNLEDYIKNNEIKCQWMFSKIDPSLDNLYIPYFYKPDNSYRKFYPDFIFWIKNEQNYEIVYVDPKGTSISDYQNKVDEFERLFIKNGEEKLFLYKEFKIIFKLRLIAKDINSVGEKYQKYWIGNHDFSFLK